jgi:hypothetical protein
MSGVTSDKTAVSYFLLLLDQRNMLLVVHIRLYQRFLRNRQSTDSRDLASGHVVIYVFFVRFPISSFPASLYKE